MNLRIVRQSFLVGIILALPTLLSTIFSKQVCESYSLFSPCAWAAGLILLITMLVLYSLGIFYMIVLYSKPKLYRSFLIVGLSNFTLFVIYATYSTSSNANDITLPISIFFIILYPSVHLAYYWLFNSLLPHLKNDVGVGPR